MLWPLSLNGEKHCHRLIYRHACQTPYHVLWMFRINYLSAIDIFHSLLTEEKVDVFSISQGSNEIRCCKRKETIESILGLVEFAKIPKRIAYNLDASNRRNPS